MFRTLLAGSAIVAVAFATGHAGPALADAPVKLWENAEVVAPESALVDKSGGVIYVSNGNNDSMAMDGDGYISKHDMDGKLTADKWATGLNAPKGMGISNGHLFVADVDALVEIDLKDGSVIARHAPNAAKLLNDVSVDSEGAVYVSDTMSNTIHRFADGKIEVWVEGDKLPGPNGVLAVGGNLIVNTWGVFSGTGWETTTSGGLLSISLADKTITPIGDGKGVGNLDGLEAGGDGSYLVSDFMAGTVIRIGADGAASEVMSLGQGTADFDYDSASNTIYVPNMLTNTLTAYTLPK